MDSFTPDDPQLVGKMRRIRLLILDVDGVLTDGGIFIGGSAEIKRFDVRDGSGIKYLMRCGVEVAFVTGRESQAVLTRARELGVEEVRQKAIKKWPVVEELITSRGLEPQQVAYVGDDLIDIPVMRRVGLAVAVADAVFEVRADADTVTRADGGHGAVRELAEAILIAQGRWEEIVNRYRAEDQEMEVASRSKGNDFNG